MANHLSSTERHAILGDFLMELFSTAIFALVAGLTYGEYVLIPAFAIGVGCAILVSSEKTQMNPVISVAVIFCEKRSRWGTCLSRIIAQLIGGIIGGVASVDGLREQVISFSAKSGHSTAKCFVFEVIFSFILVLVVLRTREKESGGLAHGLCYSSAILCGSKIFNGNTLVNPTIALGMLIGSSSHNYSQTEENYIWLYLVAPFIGCLLAILIFLSLDYLFGRNNEDEKADSSEEDTTEWLQGTSKNIVSPLDDFNDNAPTEHVKIFQKVDEDETTEFARGGRFNNARSVPGGGPNYIEEMKPSSAIHPSKPFPVSNHYQQQRNKQTVLRKRRVANTRTVNSPTNSNFSSPDNLIRARFFSL